MELVLDTEFTVQDPTAKDKKGSPYIPGNKLVMVQYKFVNTDDAGYALFAHKEYHEDLAPNHAFVQKLLDKATLLIGHNIKVDLSWLRECGFTYDGALWDTMIFEYLQARGMKPGLSLEDCAERHELDSRKSSFMKDQFALGVNVDEMPLAELIDYGMLDIYTTEELYLKQKAMVDDDTVYMCPALDLSNEFCEALTDTERAGCCIDLVALRELEAHYTQELNTLTYTLREMAQEVIGDTPINLSSPEQLSQLLYGFKINDKKAWAEMFNIGEELRNGVWKKKYPTRMKDWEVDRVISQMTTPLYKTRAAQCPDCYGKGTIPKYKKDGNPGKKPLNCKTCGKTGVVYIQTEERAGFRIKHPGTDFVTANGFSSSGDAIDKLIERAKSKKSLSTKAQTAVDFITGLSKIGSIENYLGSFIKGILENVVPIPGNDNYGLLHTNFNQCVTATGRLSSTKPNFQNLPRASTFPLRKVIVSRFPDGYILSADLAQLEFRIAAYLSQCQDAIEFIKEGRDIHMVSAEFFGIDRQSAKAETFGPLFGKRNEYAKHFYRTFPGIKRWHKTLCDEALNNKQTRSPSGRIYAYPNAVRVDADTVKPFTQIVNYPVQGFATGDILPSIFVKIYKDMKKLRLRSRLILTVHDDITADVHPEEKEIMIQVFKDAFGSVKEQCKERFSIDINVPIDYELSIGRDWLNKEKI
jgi:DNA polymerase I-like protein with 3'-5' exonuclease and polymerase domains